MKSRDIAAIILLFAVYLQFVFTVIVIVLPQIKIRLLAVEWHILYPIWRKNEQIRVIVIVLPQIKIRLLAVEWHILYPIWRKNEQIRVEIAYFHCFALSLVHTGRNLSGIYCIIFRHTKHFEHKWSQTMEIPDSIRPDRPVWTRHKACSHWS